MQSKDLFTQEMVDLEAKEQEDSSKVSEQANNSAEFKALIEEIRSLKKEVVEQRTQAEAFKYQLEELKQAQAPKRVKKVNLNVTVDEDIKNFCVKYAKKNSSILSHTINELLKQAITELKE